MQTIVFSRTAELHKLFDQQIATLSHRGCPRRVIEKLFFQKTAVVFAAAASKSAPCHIPFIPVIPQRYLTVYSQMNMLRNGSARGQTRLNLSDFEDLDIAPQGPYYLYDVDKGDMNTILRTDSSINEIEREIERSIKNQERHPLTIVEAISVALHTDILQYFLVQPLASEFSTFLYLRAGEISVPVLESHPEGSINDWCVPSYAFRRSYIK